MKVFPLAKKTSFVNSETPILESVFAKKDSLPTESLDNANLGELSLSIQQPFALLLEIHTFEPLMDDITISKNVVTTY